MKAKLMLSLAALSLAVAVALCATVRVVDSASAEQISHNVSYFWMHLMAELFR